MDSLTLLEGSYRKSRHTVDGEWQDKFRWCFGGDGGDGGGDGDGGMDVDSLSTDAPGMSAAEAEAAGMDVDSLSTDAPGKSADQAAMDEAASMQSGFAGWGLSGLPGPGEEEDSYGYTGVPDYETGRVDPAGLLDSEANFSETFGKTPAEALAEFADPSILGRVASLALGPAGLGLNALTSGILSTGIVEAGKAAGLDEASKEATGIDVTSGTFGQLFARGGPVRLQDGIGSLYGRR